VKDASVQMGTWYRIHKSLAKLYGDTLSSLYVKMPIINSREFKKKHGLSVDETLSLADISRLSGFPRPALQEVYNRGIGAYKTNPESVRLQGSFKKDASAPRSARLSKEQWAMARVYSFVMKRQSTFGGADKDIASKYKLA